MAELQTAYGQSFSFVRTYYPTGDHVLQAVKDGSQDTTEPYFLLNSAYDKMGVTTLLNPTCVTLGSDSTFYTKKSPSSNAVLSDGAYAGIVIGSVAFVIGTIFLIYMIVREKQGEPLFAPIPLNDPDDRSIPSTAQRFEGELVVVKM